VTAGGAVSGGPIGVGAVTTVPVVPGPGGTAAGALEGGPPTVVVAVPVLTGVGVVVAMMFVFLLLYLLADQTNSNCL
jgi:hypothetical protein